MKFLKHKFPKRKFRKHKFLLHPKLRKHQENLSLLSDFEQLPVWGTEWSALPRHPGVVYLNMHRHCNDSSMYQHSPLPLETVRLSLLLSMGAVVISEKSNDNDTKIFEDLVLFEPNLFSNLPWSPKVQKVLSDKQAYLAWQTNAYKLFKDKFNPRQVMLDADVWDGGYLARERGHCARATKTVHPQGEEIYRFRGVS